MKQLFRQVGIAAVPGLVFVGGWAVFDFSSLRVGWPLAVILGLGLFSGIFGSLFERSRNLNQGSW